MAEVGQQDIVWIRFPFSDLQDSEFHPVLVLSNNSYNKNNHDIFVCPVTSRLEVKEFSVLIDSSNLSRGKMPLKSRIRADKVSSVEKSMVEKSFAKLDDKTYDAVVDEINKLIKISAQGKTAGGQ